MGEKKNHFVNKKWSISFMIFGSAEWSLGRCSFFTNFTFTKSKEHNRRVLPRFRQLEIVAIIRTSLDAIGKTDTIPLFCLFALSIEVLYGCCANLWDHRENDFASFSKWFFNHRSYQHSQAKTKLSYIEVLTSANGTDNKVIKCVFSNWKEKKKNESKK